LWLNFDVAVYTAVYPVKWLRWWYITTSGWCLPC